MSFYVSVLVALLVTFLLAGSQPQHIQAASENSCQVIGSVGSVFIARCVDPDYGDVIYANSAGFLDVVE